MIVSASYRTDIPAFYSTWFAARLAAGYAMVANPYGGRPYRVSLRPEDVDGYVFWTRNIAPFRDVLAAVAGSGVPFVVQYTVTGYPRPLEGMVPHAEQAIAEIRGLAETYGPRAVVWRYDPVLISSLTLPAFHHENVARLAGALAGAVDEVCLSFAHIYRKTGRNLAAAAAAHGFTWSDPEISEKRAILQDMAQVAGDFGMAATVCSQPDLTAGSLAPARCVDARRLSDVAGHPIAARQKGNRPGCLCAESRDIGAYDTCPHGCVYCYAVADRRTALDRYRSHAPASELLVRHGT
jgi:hypothetical protein